MQPLSSNAMASGSTPKAAAARTPRRIFVGAIVTPTSLTSLRFIKRGVLGVGSTGVIRFIEDLDEVERTRKRFKLGSSSSSSSRASSQARTVVDENARYDSVSSDTAVDGSDSSEANDLHTVRDTISSAATNGSAQETADLEQLPPPTLEAVKLPIETKEDIEQHALIVHVASTHGWDVEECELITISSNSFLTPGFVDTHTHAPQVPNLGRGQQYELLDWLENVTFPREKKFEDPDYAHKTYDSVVQRMLDAGTTCAAIYATLHEDATMILADICNERGMRAFIGKCQMDRNSPQDYCEKSCSASMESTRNFVKYCRELEPYTPGSPRRGPKSPSSGSPEMDASIARLTATMNRLLKEQEEGKDGRGGKDGKISDKASSQSEQSSRSSSISTGQSTSQSDMSRTSSSATSAAQASDTPDKPSKHKRNASGQSSMSAGTGRGSTGAKATPRRRHARDYDNDLVQPILTPRFAISCSDALLAAISAFVSRDQTLRIQTHLSENGGEIAYTKELFPFCQTYTDVYDHFALLTPRTILAHAIHLEDYEMKLIAERKCGISHCPTSNMNLRSGTSRIGEMLNHGIKVGLGTDMSGGFGLSILSAIRDASTVAKVVQFSKEGEKLPTPAKSDVKTGHDFCQGPLPIATLFYLATLGGAEVCSIDHRVGSLDVGKEFDALLINTNNGCPNLFVEDDDTLEQRFEKFLFCGDDRNIASVFVRGRLVGGSSPIETGGATILS